MTELDDKILPKVKAVIARVGKKYTFTEPFVAGDFDTSDGSVTGTPSSYPGTLGSPPSDYKLTYADNGTSRFKEGTIILAGEGLKFEPKLGMKVIFDSQEVQLTEVQPIQSGEKVAAWKLRFAMS